MFLIYLFFCYHMYCAYTQNVIHEAKLDVPPWALFGASYPLPFELLNFSITDLDGLSALHWAAIHNNPRLANQLIKCDGGVFYEEFKKTFTVDVNVQRETRPAWKEWKFVLAFLPFYIYEHYFNKSLKHYAGGLRIGT